jgi:hypothetical protein
MALATALVGKFGRDTVGTSWDGTNPMGSLLIFVVVVAVKLVDPITLFLAAWIAGIATLPRMASYRWLIIFAGAAVMVALFATLQWRLSIWEGQRFRFAWVETSVASVIQISLLSLAFGAWHKRRAGKAPDAIETSDGGSHPKQQGDNTDAVKPSLPPVLYFKNNRGAFEYICEYGRHDPIGEGCLRVAIVDPDDMRRGKDGFQFVWVRVADPGGSFLARAVTAAPNVPLLRGGELVKWFAVKPEPRLASVDRLANDPRAWRQAWIVAVLAPELIVATGTFRTEVDYREFAPSPDAR